MNDSIQSRRTEIIKEVIRAESAVAEDLLKWIFASILVINSGALAATASIEKVRASIFGLTGLAFVIGIFSILISAFLTAFGYNRSSNELSELLWSGNAIEHGTYQEVVNKIRSPEKPYAIGLLLMMVSVIAFIVGCFSLSRIPT